MMEVEELTSHSGSVSVAVFFSSIFQFNPVSLFHQVSCSQATEIRGKIGLSAPVSWLFTKNFQKAMTLAQLYCHKYVDDTQF